MSKSEAQTRSELIDQHLAQSGWNVKDPTQVIEEFDILTALPPSVAEPRTPYDGHQFSDYVLLGKDRKPLAVVEAKKSSQDAAILKEGIVEQISELPLTVSFVKQEESLIRAAQSTHYWVKADEDAFDEFTVKLGPLMKFREPATGQAQTHLDLADELHKKEWVEFGPQHEAVSVSRYREMVEALIVELTVHNPILLKIKNGETVSADEAAELAALLIEEHPHITEALLRQVYKNRKAHLIQFIRHILGIEVLQSFPDTVSAAFDRFIRAHTTLNSRQLEFLDLLKNFIVEREKVGKRDLINTPFTVIHPQGIRGVFSPAEINEILQLTQRLAA